MPQADQTIKNLSKLISENWDEQRAVGVQLKFKDALKREINGKCEKPSPKLVREYKSRSDDRSIEVTIESPDVELGLEWLKKIHGEVKEISRRVKASGAEVVVRAIGERRPRAGLQRQAFSAHGLTTSRSSKSVQPSSSPASVAQKLTIAGSSSSGSEREIST